MHRAISYVLWTLYEAFRTNSMTFFRAGSVTGVPASRMARPDRATRPTGYPASISGPPAAGFAPFLYWPRRYSAPRWTAASISFGVAADAAPADVAQDGGHGDGAGADLGVDPEG